MRFCKSMISRRDTCQMIYNLPGKEVSNIYHEIISNNISPLYWSCFTKWCWSWCCSETQEEQEWLFLCYITCFSCSTHLCWGWSAGEALCVGKVSTIINFMINRFQESHFHPATSQNWWTRFLTSGLMWGTVHEWCQMSSKMIKRI